MCEGYGTCVFFIYILVSKPILQAKWSGERIDKGIISTARKETLTKCG